MTTLHEPAMIRRLAFSVLGIACVALAFTGCVLVTAPGESPHGEWAGTYAQQQAAGQDRDRDIALRVRDALAADPQLKTLGLRIFVDGAEVTLCGRYPDAATRSRAIAIVSSVDGVAGVDPDCLDH
ncbi:MAG TPA: BON domain-containing protein [Gammaproteobacteria bacterium]|nr:BON domain-containing protein [Gammaproteobacteria bacterium]